MQITRFKTLLRYGVLFVAMSAVSLAGVTQAQQTAWSGIKQFGTEETDRGYFSVIDEQGNFYVSGYTQGDLDGSGPGVAAGSFDIYVVKFDPEGNVVWIRQFGSPGEDTAVAIARDHQGHLYITGQIGGDLDPNDDQVFLEGEGEDDVFLMKLDEDGELQWLRQFGTTADDAGFGVALDTSGEPYVVGYTLGDMDGDGPGVHAGLDDIFMTAFDKDGNQLWLTQIGAPEADVAYGMALDPSGGIYLTGFSEGDLDGAGPQSHAGAMDIVAVKLNKDGEVQWVQQYGTPGPDNGYAITVDDQRRLYITGFVSDDFDGSGPDTYAGDSDVAVLTLDENGELLWSRQYGTAGNDFGLGIGVDRSGDVYASGTIFGDLDDTGPQTYQGKRDAVVVKLAPDGATQEIHQLGTPENDWGFHVTFDEEQRHVYITGQTGGDLDGSGSQTFAGVFDAFILKLENDQP
jgi:Beta-propeller repeat